MEFPVHQLSGNCHDALVVNVSNLPAGAFKLLLFHWSQTITYKVGEGTGEILIKPGCAEREILSLCKQPFAISSLRALWNCRLPQSSSPGSISSGLFSLNQAIT